MTHEPPASVERNTAEIIENLRWAAERDQSSGDLMRNLLRSAAIEIERLVLPDDVRRLVIAAREVAYSDPMSDSLRELDKAAEAFASRVPWGDQPETSTPPARPGREEIAVLSCVGGLFEHISGRWGVRWGDVELPDEYQFRPKAMEKLGQLRADAILALFDGASA